MIRYSVGLHPSIDEEIANFAQQKGISKTEVLDLLIKTSLVFLNFTQRDNGPILIIRETNPDGEVVDRQLILFEGPDVGTRIVDIAKYK